MTAIPGTITEARIRVNDRTKHMTENVLASIQDRVEVSMGGRSFIKKAAAKKNFRPSRGKVEFNLSFGSISELEEMTFDSSMACSLTWTDSFCSLEGLEIRVPVVAQGPSSFEARESKHNIAPRMPQRETTECSMVKPKTEWTPRKPIRRSSIEH